MVDAIGWLTVATAVALVTTQIAYLIRTYDERPCDMLPGSCRPEIGDTLSAC